MNQMVADIRTMRESGLSYEEMLHLAWLKHQVRSGKRTETPIEYKRLLFLRYLFSQGLIER
ncbi:MAG TPA: hypothetical protein VFC51_12050 [Chloroflexota bacterium]|nr:hypothetical protein [Chloroflexota bacterium]